MGGSAPGVEASLIAQTSGLGILAGNGLAARTNLTDIQNEASGPSASASPFGDTSGLDADDCGGWAHTKVRLNGRQTVVPRHADDLPPGTLRAILRQLGLTRTDLEV
jgi:hypothetical protein